MFLHIYNIMDRYIRHIQLEGFGQQGQRLLAGASVLVVGAGALGTVASLYLGSAGTGKITIVDFDTIDITNLQRQLSYTEGDIGRPKAETLASKVRAANSTIEVEAVNQRLTAENLPGVVAGHTVVLECSDNPATKYAVTAASQAAGVPYVAGGIAQYRGQVTAWRPGCTGYRDIFPDKSDDYLTAAEGGVLASAPGIVGSLQATEALKIITGLGSPLYDRLLLIDTLAPSFTVVNL